MRVKLCLKRKQSYFRYSCEAEAETEAAGTTAAAAAIAAEDYARPRSHFVIFYSTHRTIQKYNMI